MAKVSGEKAKMGRPTMFTPELANEICLAISTSTLGMGKLCSLHPHWPARETINEWRILRIDDFSLAYNDAKRAQADLYVEECLDIGDETDPEWSSVAKLRVDTRKWVACKLLPKIYGDRKDDDEQNKKAIAETSKVIAAGIAKAMEKNKKDY